MRFFVLALVFACPLLSFSQEKEKPYAPDRCEIVPLPENQASFQIDGVEKTRWYFGDEYPRPFFFPFAGPSGTSLTRMGHPGADNHDHHLSVWFAHHDVEGESFWANTGKTQIRQKRWIAYLDGEDEAVMAAEAGWFGESGEELLHQETVAALMPMENGEHGLEIQITLRPGGDRETTELRKTNFGILAVRVAKSVSHHFGGGQLTNSEGAVGEPNIFGKAAKWMDYTGPVTAGEGTDRKVVTEGITYFDHPENPRYPTHWHVRSDGWMGASFCFNEGWTVTKEKPLVLRYFLHAHSGDYDPDKATKVAADFAKRPGFETGKRGTAHRQWEVWRKE